MGNHYFRSTKLTRSNETTTPLPSPYIFVIARNLVDRDIVWTLRRKPGQFDRKFLRARVTPIKISALIIFDAAIIQT